ncbi:MAG: DUF6291 domain-containing protein [Alloprevotella sp.]
MIQPRIQSIILHLDNLEALRCLTAASMGNVIFALMNYAACGEMPQFKNRALMAVFHLLRAALDRDMAKYQTRCGGTAAKTAPAPTANNTAATAKTATAKTAPARTTACHNDNATANAVSPYNPLNNNNNNNNNNNSHHNDDSAREEIKMEGGEEKKKVEETAATGLPSTAEPTLTENACSEAEAESAATPRAPNSEAMNGETQNAGTMNAETQNAGTMNAETQNAEDLSFQWVYNLYDKQAGDGFFAQSVWETLTDDERRAAIEYIKAYVKMRPYKQYRKKFINFLQQRTWETEPLTDYRRPAAPAPAPNAPSCQENSNLNPNHTKNYNHGRREYSREDNIDYYRKLLAAEGYDYDSLFANY